jgi:hypothetical protein
LDRFNDRSVLEKRREDAAEQAGYKKKVLMKRGALAIINTKDSRWRG